MSVDAGELMSFDFSASQDQFVCFAVLPDAHVTSTAITSGARVSLRYSLCLPASFPDKPLHTAGDIKDFYKSAREARDAWHASANSQPPHKSSPPRMLALRVNTNVSTTALTHTQLTGIDRLRVQLLHACGFSTFVATFSTTAQTSIEDLERYSSENLGQIGLITESSASLHHSDISDEPGELPHKRRRTGSFSGRAKSFMGARFAYRGTDCRVLASWVDSCDNPLDFSSITFSNADLLEFSPPLKNSESPTRAAFLIFCTSSLVLPLALSAGLKQAADVVCNRLRFPATSAFALTEAQTVFQKANAMSDSKTSDSRRVLRTAFPSLLQLAVDLNFTEKVHSLLSDAVGHDNKQPENQYDLQTLFVPGSVESIANAVKALGWTTIGTTVRCLVENTCAVGIGHVARLAGRLCDVDKHAATQMTVNTLQKFSLELPASVDDAELIAYLAFVLPDHGFELRAIIQRCIDCKVEYGKLLQFSLSANNLQATLCLLDSLLCADMPKGTKNTFTQGCTKLPRIDWPERSDIRSHLSEAFQIHGYKALSEVFLELVRKYTDDAPYWLSVACHCESRGSISKSEAKIIGDIAQQHVDLKTVGDDGVRWLAKFILSHCADEDFDNFLEQLWMETPHSLLAVLDVTVEMKRTKFVESTLLAACIHLRAPPLGPSFEKISAAVQFMMSGTRGTSTLGKVMRMSGLTENHMVHLAYALDNPNEAGVRHTAVARDLAREAMVRAFLRNGILRGNRAGDTQRIVRNLMKCVMMFGVLNEPLMKRWFAEAPKMKMAVHCKATEGTLDALAGVSFCDESAGKRVVAIVENFMRRACSVNSGGKAADIANVFAGYVDLCRHEAKNVGAIAKLVMNGDSKVLQHCLRKRAILNVAHECEWVTQLARRRIEQIQNEAQNRPMLPDAFLSGHDDVTTFLRGAFSTMTYRKPFNGVAEARIFAKNYFGNNKLRRRIGARSKTTSVVATAGGRGTDAFVLLQKVPVRNNNNNNNKNGVGKELVQLYRLIGEAIDEGIRCEDDADDEEEDGEAKLNKECGKAKNIEDSGENKGIETVAPVPARRSSRTHSVQNRMESERKRHRRAMRESNMEEQVGKSKEDGDKVKEELV